MPTYASTCRQVGLLFGVHAIHSIVDGLNSASFLAHRFSFLSHRIVDPLGHPHCNIGEGGLDMFLDERKQFCITLQHTNIAEREGEGGRCCMQCGFVMAVCRWRLSLVMQN